MPVTGRYRLVYLVFNTLFNLLTQDDQVRCFANVADHLTDDGVFLVEAFVPAYLHRLRDDQYVDAERIEVDRVTLDVGRHDPVAQVLDESHVTFADGGVRVSPIVCRYAWPSELDLMARLAGLRLVEPARRVERRAVHGREPTPRVGLGPDVKHPAGRRPTGCAHEEQGHQPRSARRWGWGMSSTLMPTMASPRPRETLAMTSGSS